MTDVRGEIRRWADDGSDRCRVGDFQLIRVFSTAERGQLTGGQVPVFSLEMTLSLYIPLRML